MPNTATPQANPAPAGLTDNQLRAALYYAVGAATEGVRDPNKLAIAANHRSSDDTIKPVAKSGYTVGTLQTDFGSHRDTAESLVNDSQNWARQHHPDWLLGAEAKKHLIGQLQRTGDDIKKELPNEQRGHDINPTQKEHLNAFLASGPGQEWLYKQDKKQLDRLMEIPVAKMKGTHLYQSASPDDQVRLAVVAAKAYNQNEKKIDKVIGHADVAGVSTVDDFMAKVKNDPLIHPQIRQDAPKALHAANLAVALRQANDTNPLKPVWGQIERQPLPNPSQPMNSHLTAQYAATRSLFIEHQNGAPELIAALNHGQPFPATPSRGIPSLATDGHNLIVADQIHPDKVHALSAGGEAETVERDRLRWSQPTAGHTRDLQLAQGGQNQSLLQAMPAPVQTRRRGRSLSR